jgi:polar amino acid transport system substrate-binding protein
MAGRAPGNQIASFGVPGRLASGLLALGLAGWGVFVGGSAEAASLAVIRERGTLHVCAHPEALPFSSQDPSQPGLQLELAGALARELGVRLAVDWIVFTRHARRVECDALMGWIVPNGAEGTKGSPRGLRLTRPYAGGGYLLAVPAATAGAQGPADLGGKVGVEHTSWPHYLLSTRGVPTASFVSQTDILDALVTGEIAGGMVTMPYFGWYLKQHPGARLKLAEGYAPEADLRWSVAVGLRQPDEALLQAVDAALGRFVADGTIPAIFARYGITYTPPSGPPN